MTITNAELVRIVEVGDSINAWTAMDLTADLQEARELLAALVAIWYGPHSSHKPDCPWVKARAYLAAAGVPVSLVDYSN